MKKDAKPKTPIKVSSTAKNVKGNVKVAPPSKVKKPPQTQSNATETKVKLNIPTTIASKNDSPCENIQCAISNQNSEDILIKKENKTGAKNVPITSKIDNAESLVTKNQNVETVAMKNCNAEITVTKNKNAEIAAAKSCNKEISASKICNKVIASAKNCNTEIAALKNFNKDVSAAENHDKEIAAMENCKEENGVTKYGKTEIADTKNCNKETNAAQNCNTEIVAVENNNAGIASWKNNNRCNAGIVALKSSNTDMVVYKNWNLEIAAAALKNWNAEIDVMEKVFLQNAISTSAIAALKSDKSLAKSSLSKNSTIPWEKINQTNKINLDSKLSAGKRGSNKIVTVPKNAAEKSGNKKLNLGSELSAGKSGTNEINMESEIPVEKSVTNKINPVLETSAKKPGANQTNIVSETLAGNPETNGKIVPEIVPPKNNLTHQKTSTGNPETNVKIVPEIIPPKNNSTHQKTSTGNPETNEKIVPEIIPPKKNSHQKRLAGNPETSLKVVPPTNNSHQKTLAGKAETSVKIIPEIIPPKDNSLQKTQKKSKNARNKSTVMRTVNIEMKSSDEKKRSKSSPATKSASNLVPNTSKNQKSEVRKVDFATESKMPKSELDSKSSSKRESLKGGIYSQVSGVTKLDSKSSQIMRKTLQESNVVLPDIREKLRNNKTFKNSKNAASQNILLTADVPYLELEQLFSANVEKYNFTSEKVNNSVRERELISQSAKNAGYLKSSNNGVGSMPQRVIESQGTLTDDVSFLEIEKLFSSDANGKRASKKINKNDTNSPKVQNDDVLTLKNARESAKKHKNAVSQVTLTDDMPFLEIDQLFSTNVNGNTCIAKRNVDIKSDRKGEIILPKVENVAVLPLNDSKISSLKHKTKNVAVLPSNSAKISSQKHKTVSQDLLTGDVPFIEFNQLFSADFPCHYDSEKNCKNSSNSEITSQKSQNADISPIRKNEKSARKRNIVTHSDDDPFFEFEQLFSEDYGKNCASKKIIDVSRNSKLIPQTQNLGISQLKSKNKSSLTADVPFFKLEQLFSAENLKRYSKVYPQKNQNNHEISPLKCGGKSSLTADVPFLEIECLFSADESIFRSSCSSKKFKTDCAKSCDIVQQSVQNAKVKNGDILLDKIKRKNQKKNPCKNLQNGEHYKISSMEAYKILSKKYGDEISYLNEKDVKISPENTNKNLSNDEEKIIASKQDSSKVIKSEESVGSKTEETPEIRFKDEKQTKQIEGTIGKVLKNQLKCKKASKDKKEMNYNIQEDMIQWNALKSESLNNISPAVKRENGPKNKIKIKVANASDLKQEKLTEETRKTLPKSVSENGISYAKILQKNPIKGQGFCEVFKFDILNKVRYQINFQSDKIFESDENGKELNARKILKTASECRANCDQNGQIVKENKKKRGLQKENARNNIFDDEENFDILLGKNKKSKTRKMKNTFQEMKDCRNHRKVKEEILCAIPVWKSYYNN